MSDLDKKIKQSIRLLQHLGDTEVELSYSGGKDSDVILALAKMAGINYRAIYKNTTIDPPGTVVHCKENGVEIVKPKKTFFELIQNSGFPTRRARFCCDELKEYKILDNSIQGIRRSESTKRAELYKEPVICRIYGSKKNHVNVYLPILEWTDEDVKNFITHYGIKCHQLYYDENGEFCVNRRLGCIGCPLSSDNGLSGFKKYPKLVRQWIRAGQIWWDKDREKEPNSKRKFADVYELFAHNVFFDSYQEFVLARDGMFGHMNFKEKLEEYFGIEL